MSDLLSLLQLGSSAVAAQNAGVAVATNNVANANTAGYTRQRVDLSEIAGVTASTGGGVLSGAAVRSGTELLAGRMRDASASLGRTQTTSDTLSDFEQALAGGTQISDTLTATFARLQQVAAAPTDPDQRSAAVAQLGDLASAFRTNAQTISDARAAADGQLSSISQTASGLAKQLAAANAAAASGDPAALDQRDQVAQQLTQLVGGSARVDGDGQMRFVLDGGAVLVDGTHAASLASTVDTSTGDATVQFVDGNSKRDITGQISGGQLGGTLASRAEIQSAGTALDQLASDVATSFNAVSQANAGTDGVSGRNMFVPPTTIRGAAAALAVDPGLAADPGQLATAAAGAPSGDNSGATALAHLATATVATGGKTLGDASLAPLTQLAQQVKSAKADASADAIVSSHLSDLNDSVSGVDLTEEQTNLARFSSASQALTKFLSTINDMLSNLITNL